MLALASVGKRARFTHIILIDFLIKIKPGHTVLVDLDSLRFSLGVELLSTKSEEILLGVGQVGVRGQLNPSVAFLRCLDWLGRVNSKGLGPVASWATGRGSSRRSWTSG